MDLHELARAYRAAGLSIIPILPDGSKAPALGSWNEFRERRATDAELKDWFGTGELVGIAVVCGIISGGLEVLDFDDVQAWEDWLADPAIAKAVDWRALPRVRTPTGGVHIYVWRQVCGRCRTLARDEKGGKLIEVKAEGGYVLAPGCPPECHPLATEYVWEVPLPALQGVA